MPGELAAASHDEAAIGNYPACCRGRGVDPVAEMNACVRGPGKSVATFLHDRSRGSSACPQ
jgi:hypothetical protein